MSAAAMANAARRPPPAKSASRLAGGHSGVRPWPEMVGSKPKIINELKLQKNHCVIYLKNLFVETKKTKLDNLKNIASNFKL
jgi:hypothetical protein